MGLSFQQKSAIRHLLYLDEGEVTPPIHREKCISAGEHGDGEKMCDVFHSPPPKAAPGRSPTCHTCTMQAGCLCLCRTAVRAMVLPFV